MLPDPVRRRQRYVLCLAILGNKLLSLTSHSVIIRSLLFGVAYSGAQKPRLVVLFLTVIVGHDAMDSAMHLGPKLSLIWESCTGQVRQDILLPPPTLSTFVGLYDSRFYEIRNGTKSASNQ